jgi:hypothetical protein
MTPSRPTQPMPAPNSCVCHQMADKQAPPLRLRERKLSTYPVDVGARFFLPSPAPRFRCSRQIRPEENPMLLASTVVDAALASPMHPHIGRDVLAQETEVNTNNLKDWIGDNVFARDLPAGCLRDRARSPEKQLLEGADSGRTVSRRDHLLRARR